MSTTATTKKPAQAAPRGAARAPRPPSGSQALPPSAAKSGSRPAPSSPKARRKAPAKAAAPTRAQPARKRPEPQPASPPAKASEKPAGKRAPSHPAKTPAGKSPAKQAQAAPTAKPSGAGRLTKLELQELEQALLAERARLAEVVEGLRQESLLRHDEVNHEEDGTDAFIRLSGIDRASNEQQQIVRIDEALRALREGHYGLCERCGCKIEINRLQALPFVKTCIRCQSEAEDGFRNRMTARHRLMR